MKIILITMGFEREFPENVGVGRIKTYLDHRQHLADIVYFSKGDNMDETLAKIDQNCNLYGFSTYDKSLLDIIEIAKVLKARNKDCVTFIGSKYVTCYYKELLSDPRLSAIDYAVLGDGEYTIERMMNCINEDESLIDMIAEHPHIASRNSLDGKTPCALDVNSLPLPDRSMIIEQGGFHAYICDSHGCCNNCSFCTHGNYYKKWNGRTAQDIYEEMKVLYEKSNVIFFDFTGGSFEDPGKLGKQKIQQLCNLVIDNNMKISMKCYLRANSFQPNEADIELLKTMKRAGFHTVFVGVESGNNEDLKLYNKHTEVRQNKQMLQLLSDVGIYCGSFGFIMLNPYSTRRALRENYDFLVDVKSHNFLTYVNKLVAYLGTSMSERISRDGLAMKGDVLLQGLTYQYKNPEIIEIDRFITSCINNDDVGKLATNTDGIPLFIHEMHCFLEEGPHYIQLLNDILDEYYLELKQFFELLYVNNDIVSCEHEFNSFYNKISALDEKLVRLKHKFIKALIKCKVIKSSIL